MSVIQFIIASLLLLATLAGFIQMAKNMDCRDQAFINGARIQLLATVDKVNPLLKHQLEFNLSCNQYLKHDKKQVQVHSSPIENKAWRLNFALYGKISNK